MKGLGEEQERNYNAIKSNQNEDNTFPLNIRGVIDISKINIAEKTHAFKPSPFYRLKLPKLN